MDEIGKRGLVGGGSSGYVHVKGDGVERGLSVAEKGTRGEAEYELDTIRVFDGGFDPDFFAELNG